MIGLKKPMKRSIHSEATGTGARSFFDQPEKPPQPKRRGKKKKKESLADIKKEGSKAFWIFLLIFTTVLFAALYLITSSTS